MADNSLLCSKYVQSILEENEEVKSILGTDQHKIFPLLQPDQLTFPFIVHARTSLTTQYTKNLPFGFGWTNDVTYTVNCVSNDYIQCIELANAVRHAMEGYQWKDENIHIEPIQLQQVSEYTIDDTTFVEELQFKLQIT
jgi:hypothetical protein